ncbi:hypothetical protein KCP70_09840 [Salmonella enterica subsp. enterica]|nr:hypothetical protein KCP70_09840 [Salmonella enterica subsp. enterica]
MSVQCLNGISGRCCTLLPLCRFFLDLPVVKYLLMPFLSDLFFPIYPAYVRVQLLLLALAVEFARPANVIAVTVHQ